MDLLKMLADAAGSRDREIVSVTDLTDQEKALVQTLKDFISEANRRAGVMSDEIFTLIAKRLGFDSTDAMHDQNFSLKIDHEKLTSTLNKERPEKAELKKVEVGSAPMSPKVQAAQKEQQARIAQTKKLMEELTETIQKDRGAMWDEVARSFGYQDNLDAIAKGAYFEVSFEKGTVKHLKNEAIAAAAAQ